ncbi:MAG: enoyl-CoA hydratase/isomerase family protein [Acidimicrobiales bacterium]
MAATQPQSIRSAHVALARCPHPLIVALEGFAINGGAALALAGDIVVVGDDDFIQVAEVKLGMAAPNNLAWLCARYSPATVLQIVLVGDRIYGRRMVELGLAYESVSSDQVLARATELANQLAHYPAGAAAALKRETLRIAGLDDVDGWFENVGAPAVANMPTGLMK